MKNELTKDKEIDEMIDRNTVKFMFQSMQAQNSIVNKRQFIIILLLIAALIGTNAGWIWWESQWAYVKSETEVTQELEAENNAIINDGVHINDKD